MLVRSDLPAGTRAGALTSIQTGGLGKIELFVRVGISHRTAELIAHEFEHIIEQLDGVDLRAKSRQAASRGQARRDSGHVRDDARHRHRPAGRARAAGTSREHAAVTGWRLIVLAAATAGSWWLATVETVTIAQRDRFRSARAPRSADVSADGRSVAFESLARLVPADTDDRADIYVLDRGSGRVTLESATADDDSEHTAPRISGDGRYVVFEVRAGRSDAASPRTDIVLHDRVAGTSRVLTATQKAIHMPGAGAPTSATTAASWHSRLPRRR